MAPTPEKQALFLALLRQGRTVEGAARNVGIHRSTLYRFRDRNEEFRRAWDEVWEAGIEALEDELRRRGFEGVEKPVFHSGVVVGTVREFGTTAAICQQLSQLDCDPSLFLSSIKSPSQILNFGFQLGDAECRLLI